MRAWAQRREPTFRRREEANLLQGKSSKKDPTLDGVFLKGLLSVEASSAQTWGLLWVISSRFTRTLSLTGSCFSFSFPWATVFSWVTIALKPLFPSVFLPLPSNHPQFHGKAYFQSWHSPAQNVRAPHGPHYRLVQTSSALCLQFTTSFLTHYIACNLHSREIHLCTFSECVLHCLPCVKFLNLKFSTCL